ncbi:glycosyltransferase family 2 protein [Archaeoglobales archaeon]|nr:MAG: glycosyltransferase family 2 protein [Archaeoglobales archaeon]
MKTFDKKIAVIIPAYNEERRIGSVIEGIKSLKMDLDIIVVDDGSIDETAKKAKELGARVCRHIVNRGVGAATKTGIYFALELGAELLVFIDADGQHNPKEIPKLIEPIARGEADVVLGSRFRGDTSSMPLVKRFGNKILNFVVRLLYGVKYTDTQCGFRAISRDVALLMKKLDIERYGFLSEMLGEINKRKLRVVEVPVETIYTDKKGTDILDGISIVVDLLVRRFVRW